MDEVALIPEPDQPQDLVPVEREKMVTKPRIEIDLAEVERLASLGLSQVEIALNLGISPTTFQARKRESEEFADAVTRGRAAGTNKAAGILNDIMNTADAKTKLDAAKFFLARRSQWSETVQNEVSGPGGGAIQITISKDDAAL
mgnify:FL=1